MTKMKDMRQMFTKMCMMTSFLVKVMVENQSLLLLRVKKASRRNKISSWFTGQTSYNDTLTST